MKHSLRSVVRTVLRYAFYILVGFLAGYEVATRGVDLMPPTF